MTIPSDESKEAGNSFHLSYNRSGLGCLILIVCTPLTLILFWKFAPADVILRLGLNYRLGYPSRDTIKNAGPSAVPVLKEFMSHVNPGTRMIAVNTAGIYIEYHPEESQPVISALCQSALHDKKISIKINAIHALRNARFPSDIIDKTTLKLLRNKDEEIRRAAESSLLIRIVHEIEISNSLCVVRDQLKPYLDRLEPDSCSAKPLKAFLEKCENIDQEK